MAAVNIDSVVFINLASGVVRTEIAGGGFNNGGSPLLVSHAASRVQARGMDRKIVKIRIVRLDIRASIFFISFGQDKLH